MSQYPPQRESFLDLVWRYKYRLGLYILGVSFLSFTALYLLGVVPDELRVLDDKLPPPAPLATTTPGSGGSVVADLPERIVIDKIGIDTPVQNPDATDDKTLNAELLKGAVRYPGSGTLGKGNMFLFGHSTGIRVVNNQAYKAFNRLRELRLGDVIRIQSGTKEYNYKVTSVSLVDSDAKLVDFTRKADMVTLSTCNVFGEKQERFVVEAIFVKSIPLE